MTQEADTSPEVTSDLEPTEPGFYRYSGGRQNMIFLLREPGEWFAILDNTQIDRCQWSYIEQALGVWTLEKIAEDSEEGLTKRDVVMKRHEFQRSAHYEYFEAPNDGSPPDERTDGYYMTNDVWTDFGQPEEITVTVVPGNTLN